MWDPIDSACFWLENFHVGARDAESHIQRGFLAVLRDQKPVVSFGRIKPSFLKPIFFKLNEKKIPTKYQKQLDNDIQGKRQERQSADQDCVITPF